MCHHPSAHAAAGHPALAAAQSALRQLSAAAPPWLCPWLASLCVVGAQVLQFTSFYYVAMAAVVAVSGLRRAVVGSTQQGGVAEKPSSLLLPPVPLDAPFLSTSMREFWGARW